MACLLTMSALGEYLERVSDVPFSRGGMDCCIFVADWVLQQTGCDPAEGLRGYSTDAGAMLRIGRAGGFLALACEAFALQGFKAVSEARPGDVAIVEAGSADGKAIYTMAIRASKAWACKEGSGITLTKAKPVVVWRIGDGD